MNDYNCIAVLGPTASGKTRLACALAYHMNGEIISADSRQVYKHLDIGTGKDLSEYVVQGKQIPYHLIDVCEPRTQFYLHDFIAKCEEAFNAIISRKHIPIICGGTGLYLDALRKDFSYTQVAEDTVLRKELESRSKEELLRALKKYPDANTRHTDTNSKKRIIRAIEVARFLTTNPHALENKTKPYRPVYIGVNVTLEERKKRISERLKYRLGHGLVEEVEALLKNGITHERLRELGLEYKFLSMYLMREISKTEMYSRLETAIFQYAKRQMTWFRKMEKEGVNIHWVESGINIKELLSIINWPQ